MDLTDAVGLLLVIGLVLTWPASTAWAGYDAYRRAQSWLPIAFGVGAFWPLGLFAWLLLRPDLPEEQRP